MGVDFWRGPHRSCQRQLPCAPDHFRSGSSQLRLARAPSRPATHTKTILKLLNHVCCLIISLRILGYLVKYDSGKVSLEHLLLSRHPSRSPPLSTLRYHPFVSEWPESVIYMNTIKVHFEQTQGGLADYSEVDVKLHPSLRA